jgi:acyl carrier protein
MDHARTNDGLAARLMKISEVIVVVGIGVVGTYVITMVVRDRLKNRRAVKSLRARAQHDDEGFARAYFPEPKQGDIAIRARRVLAANLNMPLRGLKPTDRLNEDLNAELERNPDLFWDLEEEFGIKTGLEDADIDKIIQRLVTFEDLVKFLEERISATPPNAPVEDEDEKPSWPYRWAIRAIPVLCIAGLGMAVAGIFFKKKTMMNVGGMIFVSGFAVWGFSNGGELLRSIIQEYRGRSWKEIAANGWGLMFQIFLVLFFLWIGAMITWALLKAAWR